MTALLLDVGHRSERVGCGEQGEEGGKLRGAKEGCHGSEVN